MCPVSFNSDPNALYGLEALARIQNLKFRTSKKAFLEISEKGDPGFEYYVNHYQNSMVMYSKVDQLEVLKIFFDHSTKSIKMYNCDQFLGQAEVTGTGCSGVAEQVILMLIWQIITSSWKH